jgi:acetolactate synthase-1/2/3 large subunit
MAFLDAFHGYRDRIEVLMPRHEQSAVHFADGYYRSTGKPLAVYTSIGPGAINTAMGVATAYVDSCPVILFTGDVHTYMQGKGVLQEIDRVKPANFPAVMEPIVKRAWRPNTPAHLPAIMQRAFQEMLSGRRGPVLIDLPMDVQAESADVDIPNPDEHTFVSPVCPDPVDIRHAAEMLLRASRPVILVGGGVLHADATEELRELAELTGAAVIATMNAKGAFPENKHPLSGLSGGSKGTVVGNYLARNADVLLAVGVRFADQTASSYRNGATYNIPPTKLIHMDLEPGQIGKNYPTEIGITADAKTGLRYLIEEIRQHRPRYDFLNASYTQEIIERRAAWYASFGDRVADHHPVTISRFLRELRAHIDDDAIIAHSSGNVQAAIMSEFPFYAPRTNLTSGGFSTMGWAYPAALGAKMAHPERQVVALVGDGDFLMTMQEMAFAAQHEIPTVVCVLNNMGWQAIKDLQIEAYGPERTLAVEFTRGGAPYSPDFQATAKAFGLHSQRISRADEVGPALRAAFASGQPALIEVIVNRDYPISGSPATGWWDVPVPAYLEQKRAKYEAERAQERL